MTQLADPALQQVLDDAVAEFSRITRFPIAFGGFEVDGITTVSSLHGNRGMSVMGLQVANTRGLGGRAKIEHRPRFTTDYMSSQQISHDYDCEIGAENIVMLVAVPVIVSGITRAVLYGGTRGGSGPDSSFLRSAAGIAHDLGQEIRIQDEVTKRLATHTPAAEPTLPGALLEELRSGYAELRRIAADTDDPVTRERLEALEARLSHLGKPQDVPSDIRLTPRETDVLTHAALGNTNAEIGHSLGLTESTVKSYLKTVMSKLDASTRHAAVATARSYGLIP